MNLLDILLILLLLSYFSLKTEFFNSSKPTPQVVIDLFKSVKKSNGNLDKLNEMIHEKGFPDYNVSLRAFFQMVKLLLKDDLTPSNIKHFL